jgi:predicted phage tail protein
MGYNLSEVHKFNQNMIDKFEVYSISQLCDENFICWISGKTKVFCC